MERALDVMAEEELAGEVMAAEEAWSRSKTLIPYKRERDFEGRRHSMGRSAHVYIYDPDKLPNRLQVNLLVLCLGHVQNWYYS